MRGESSSGAATILLGALLVAGGALANPTGVPVPESPPLSCITSNFSITTNFMATQFPVPDVCNGEPCTKYGYMISSPTQANVDHAVFSLSATQDFFGATGPAFTVYPLGAGDNVTGFLAGARHEYAIRFNSNNTKSEMTYIWIKGGSKPRLGTVLIRSGNKAIESCLIATPGTTGDPFQPVFQSQTALVAGGKCQVNLVFDASGNVIDVNPVSGSSCIKYEGPVNVTIGTQTGPLRNNAGPHGITFGNGTTTCYGPPVPSVPRCICTAQPCP